MLAFSSALVAGFLVRVPNSVFRRSGSCSQTSHTSDQGDIFAKAFFLLHFFCPLASQPWWVSWEGAWGQDDHAERGEKLLPRGGKRRCQLLGNGPGKVQGLRGRASGRGDTAGMLIKCF